VDLVLAGAKVEDIGGFIERWYKAGAIKADGTTYQDVIAMAYGYEVQRITDYNEVVKVMSNGVGIQHGTMRFYSEKLEHEHNVNLYNYDGGWYVSDVGSRWNHGKSWDIVLGKEINFRYYQYLIKRK
jgi:hypothetical protein